MKIEIIPLTGIAEVLPGANLPALLAAAISDIGTELRPGDILVVTQKIVSKAEGRFRDLSNVAPSLGGSTLGGRDRKGPSPC